MKKLREIKIRTSSVRWIKAFSQFASDLDQATQNQLARGQRLRELLKQAQSSPLSLEDQVTTIYAGTNGYLDGLAIDQVRPFLVELRQNLATNKADYGKMIRETEAFSPEAEAILKETLIELTS
jgi:F-type H+-transporting ATPase subunit alpha